MPLMPKRVKDNHRKMHRGNRGGNATSGDYVAFGDFGLQVLTRGWAPRIRAPERAANTDSKLIRSDATAGDTCRCPIIWNV